MRRNETQKPRHGSEFQYMSRKMDNAMTANKSAAPAASNRSMVSEEKEAAWAEVAKFNELLDYKIKLDNAEE